MTRLITYENGDKVVWNGRAEIHYHQTKIVDEQELGKITFDEHEALKRNPHDKELLIKIKNKSKIE